MNDEAKVHDAEFVEETAMATTAAPLAVQQHGQLAGPADVKAMLAKADAQIEFRRGLVKLIATKIDPRDVVIYGKSPRESIHFAKQACKQVLSWIEADIKNVRIVEHHYTNKDGPYILFECSGEMTLPGGRVVNVIGSRATYDDFFGTVGGGARPLNEVDVPSVRMAAVTSMWNHALEDAGMKPTLQELVDGRMDLNKCSYVNFKDRPAVGAAAESHSTASTAQTSQNSGTASAAASQPSGDVISEPQAKRLFAIAKGLGYSQDDYRKFLREEFAVNSDRDLAKSRYKAAEEYLYANKKN